MKCEKCGSEDLEIKIVDIKNEKDSSLFATVILIVSWMLAIFSAIFFIRNVDSSSLSNDDIWKIITGTIVDSIETVILWKMFSISVISIIVCSLFNKLLPYKVIPVKKAVCKSCGNEQDDTE